ncbi:MAG: NfeD family protein, partial [Steroidobacteraceae bacterium]
MSIASRRQWQVVTALGMLSAAASPAQQPVGAHAPAATALLLEIRDAIGPATSDFFVRTLE